MVDFHLLHFSSEIKYDYYVLLFARKLFRTVYIYTDHTCIIHEYIIPNNIEMKIHSLTFQKDKSVIKSRMKFSYPLNQIIYGTILINDYSFHFSESTFILHSHSRYLTPNIPVH